MSSDSHILVVDDDPEILSGTARLLTTAGYHTMTAQTGQQALDVAQKYLPDVILLDNVLPDIHGTDVCRRLKAEKATAGIFISILSGSKTHASDKSDGLECGADEYITRPIGNRELLARVKAMLRLRNAEKELEWHRHRLEDLVAKRTDELNNEIDGHKQAKEALIRSKTFSQSVLNSLTAHIAVLDKSGDILAVNHAWRDFARHNGGNEVTVSQDANYFIACRQAADSAEGDSAVAALQGIMAVMNGEKSVFSLEYPCHSPTEQRFFEMKVVPLVGVQKRVVVAHENMTELKQTEARLRQRSQELAMLNRVSTQASHSLSAEQVTSNALESLLQATEASAAFLLKKQGDELMPIGIAFADPSRTFAEFPTHKLGECLCGMAVTEHRGIYSMDIEHDMRCTWEECKQAGLRSAAALPLFGGHDIIAVLGLGTDYPHDFAAHTEYLETLAAAVALGLKNAQLFEQTQQHAQDLETEVRKRTLELENAQKTLMSSLEDIKQANLDIEAANHRLQELDRLKSMFIASMSHELRTPLNSIIGFTGILLQGLAGDLNAEQHDQLSRVRRAGTHLLALISDVIDVSKIEAGKVDLYREAIDVGKLIDEARVTVQHDAAEKGLILRTDVAEPIMLYTDRRRLLQCVVNLLSNAVKYSEHGTIAVTAGLTGQQVCIRVADTGIGIAESDLPRLFTSFVRLESHLKTRVSGTGLGLYLTKKIVTDLLGGTIDVISRLGQGSTFELMLPVADSSRQQSGNSEWPDADRVSS